MKSLPFLIIAGIGIFLFFFFTRKASADTGASYSAMPNDVSGGSNVFGGTLTSIARKGLESLGTVSLPGLGTVSPFPVFGAVGVGSEILEKKTGVTAATAINSGYEIPKQTIISGVQTAIQTANDIKANPARNIALPLIYTPTKAATNFVSNTVNRIFGSKVGNTISKLTFGIF